MKKSRKKTREKMSISFEKCNGYICVLLCIVIPIFLLSVKYTIDTMTKNRTKLHENGEYIYKKCAKKAALEVAKHWNPGVSFYKQRGAMLKIADGIYNSEPAFCNSVLGNAIPGLEEKSNIEVLKSNKLYAPLDVRYKATESMGPKIKTIDYHNVQIKKWRGKFDALGMSIGEIYRRAYFLIKNSEMALEEPFWDVVPFITGGKNRNVFTFSSLYAGLNEQSNVQMNNIAENGEFSVDYFYSTRINPNDPTLQISVNNDRIKVQADSDVGYAVPAECNVDLIISIPTNMAACNEDNRDSSSFSVGAPSIVTTDTSSIIDSKTLSMNNAVKKMRATPIYQIAQAYRDFLNDHFKHTRGVNIGLIPYSGKLSIPPEKKDSWTEKIFDFDISHFLQDQNLYLHYIKGIFLYGTLGEKGAALSIDRFDNWGEANAQEVADGSGIMYRGSVVSESKYGENKMHIADLLSCANTDDYKFSRFNHCPCYLGHANFLSMKCDFDCTKYYHNPYFVTELMSDVEKVYDLLNVIVPFNDDKNASNFVFLPITWANNFFQSWTSDPANVAANTTNDESLEGGRLSHQSKSASGRKKALILLVNKPDYFEHGELTYLGFNNDFSEIPLIESDCITFDINHENTNKRFADGSKFDGNTIQGAKKILKYETITGALSNESIRGYYECLGSATGRLTFPEKRLLKVVVGPAITWKNVDSKSSDLLWGIAPTHEGAVILTSNGTIISTNGDNWLPFAGTLRHIRDDGRWRGICYGNGKYIAINYGGEMASSIDGKTWVDCGANVKIGAMEDLYFDESDNRYIMISGSHASYDGINWQPIEGGYRDICGEKGNYVAIANGNAYGSADLNNWERIDDTSLSALCPGCHSICYGNGYYYAVNDSTLVMSRDAKRWATVKFLSSGTRAIRYIKSLRRIVITNIYRNITCSIDNALFQFKNISSSMNSPVTSNAYEITGKREFFIEPSQISDVKDADGNYYVDFNMSGIRLISAEITNQPYNKITPTCSISGVTSAAGKTEIAYVNTNIKEPLTIKAKVMKIGSVIFENINGTNIANATYDGGKNIISGTNINITEKTTFNFPTSCFGGNYKDQKIKYSSNNINIIDAKLVDRCIRFNDAIGGNRTDKAAITENCRYQPCMNVADDSNPYVVCVPLTNLILVDGVAGGSYKGDCQNCTCKFYGDGGIGETMLRWRFKAGQGQRILLTATNEEGYFFETNSFAGWKNEGQCSSGPQSGIKIGNFLSSSPTPYFYISCMADWWSCCTTGYGGYNFNYFNFYYSDQYSLNNGITLEYDNICFNCTGNLAITAEPATSTGKITYNKTAIDSVKKEIFNCEYETILITPEEYYYEKQSDGTYKIKLELENAQISDVEMVNTNVVLEYLTPRMPEMSRVVDLTKKSSDNNFVYNVCGTEITGINNYILGGRDPDGTIGSMGIRWNAINDYWEMYHNAAFRSQSDHFFMMNYSGDMYMLANSTNSSWDQLYYKIWTDVNNTGVKYLYDYFGSSFYRSFWPFVTHRRIPIAETNIFGYSFETFYVVLPMVYVGFTLPINSALYYGSDGEVMHKHQWQSDSKGVWNGNDASEACQKVTTDACAKLKSDFGSNLRVYVVKYRKQNEYKHKTNGSVVNFNYAYIDACASSPSNVYDVGDEEGLKRTLKAIASDIKTFSGYSQAKNVD